MTQADADEDLNWAVSVAGDYRRVDCEDRSAGGPQAGDEEPA
ncbi:hypothetical protein OG936_34055 [Streptomyces sp. NBC_00846]|nr:hypothetical protein OG936_34055 [Streptomyces sp. NBC_00846]